VSSRPKSTLVLQIVKALAVGIPAAYRGTLLGTSLRDVLTHGSRLSLEATPASFGISYSEQVELVGGGTVSGPAIKLVRAAFSLLTGYYLPRSIQASRLEASQEQQRDECIAKCGE
jgi:hypothetical protein